MTIGIMTYYDSFNFGSLLQAYALQFALSEMGETSEIIAFERKKLQAASGGSRPPAPLRRRIARRLIEIRHEPARKQRNIRFDEFREKHLYLTSRRYLSAEELWESAPDYDTYVCGSDQVWNPYHSDFIRLFLLEFAAEGKRKVAYAPSFGVDDISQCREYPEIVAALRRFDHLSVREQQGVRIVRDACGRTPTRVLDPTMLLTPEQWSRVGAPVPFQRPYILFYALAPFSRRIGRFVNNLRRREHCDVVVVPHARHNFVNRFQKAFFAGPREFVTLVKNARAVITNSFHGTAFAILYQKPFFAFVGETAAAAKRSSRITDLLQILDLSDRFLHPGPATWPERLGTDFCNSQPRLERERGLSLDYLRTAVMQTATGSGSD